MRQTTGHRDLAEPSTHLRDLAVFPVRNPELPGEIQNYPANSHSPAARPQHDNPDKGQEAVKPRQPIDNPSPSKLASELEKDTQLSPAHEGRMGSPSSQFFLPLLSLPLRLTEPGSSPSPISIPAEPELDATGAVADAAERVVAGCEARRLPKSGMTVLFPVLSLAATSRSRSLSCITSN